MKNKELKIGNFQLENPFYLRRLQELQMRR